MKKTFKFMIKNKHLLNFGFMFNFFSFFGQTFFISIFVPFWLELFNITNSGFGVIYASITILSAVLLSLFGRYVDKMQLKYFGLIVFSMLMGSALFLSKANTLVTLIMGLFLVRWLGQGLMTHTSETGMAKHFNKTRGKALGLTKLGHPAGQFIIPLIMVPLLYAVGWRSSLLYLIIIAAVIVLPCLWIVHKIKGFEPDAAEFSYDHFCKKAKQKINFLKTKEFWLITANIFILPFIVTTILLYQYVIADAKGWAPSWVAFSFTFFAAFSALSLIFSGFLIDKYSGVRLFPLYLFPSLVSIILITFIDSKMMLPIFYALLGISIGLGETIRTAVQAEIFGTRNLGKIRSYSYAIVVLGTALGPLVFGYLSDINISFNSIMLFFSFILLLIIGISFRLRKI